MNTISNTLTRWHKIAERLKSAVNQLATTNVAAMTVTHIESDTLEVRQETLKAAANKAIGEQTALLLSLQTALFSIRRALAKANVEHRISDLLNDLEHAKQKMNYDVEIVSTAECALSEDEFHRLADKRSKSAVVLQESGVRASRVLAENHRVTVTFLAAVQLRDLVTIRESLRTEMNALSDLLADANATKLSLSMSADVTRYLGL